MALFIASVQTARRHDTGWKSTPGAAATEARELASASINVQQHFWETIESGGYPTQYRLTLTRGFVKFDISDVAGTPGRAMLQVPTSDPLNDDFDELGITYYHATTEPGDDGNHFGYARPGTSCPDEFVTQYVGRVNATGTLNVLNAVLDCLDPGAPEAFRIGLLAYTAAENLAPAGNIAGMFDTLPLTLTIDCKPTLTTVATSAGAQMNQWFDLTFTTLATAADEADPDSPVITFRIEEILAGTLTMGPTRATSQPVAEGTTIFSGGLQHLYWRPPTGQTGDIAAFTITAWDGALGSDTPVTVTINVAEGNHPPTLTQLTVMMGGEQDTPYNVSYAVLSGVALNFADPDPGDTLSFRFAGGLRPGSTLKKGGTDCVSGETLLSPGETWVFTPAPGDNGMSVPVFFVKAYDGTIASADAVQAYLTLAAAEPPETNHPPTLTYCGPFTDAVEDTPYLLPFATMETASDLDDEDEGDTLSFRITGILAGNLYKDGTELTGDGTELFGAGETLTWEPPAGIGAIAAFTVKGWDGEANSDEDVTVTFHLTGHTTDDTEEPDEMRRLLCVRRWNRGI